MSEMGRPPIEVDWEKFEFACRLMATQEEICGLLKVSDTTLQRKIKEKYDNTFEGVLKELSGEIKVSLRRKQIKLAVEDGNVTMLIWLGKNMLGQKDTPFIEQHTHFTKIAKLEIPAAFKSQDEWEKFVEHLKADSATTHNAQLPGV